MSQPNDSTPAPPPHLANAELIVLEALKIAHASTGTPQYLDVHEQLRRRAEERRARGNDGSSGLRPTVSAAAVQTPARGANSASAPRSTAPTRIRVVCATRKDREDFFAATPLGKSLSLLRPPGVELRLFPRNSDGLPALYNQAISESIKDEVIFLFIHDDVHLCDFHWASRLAGGIGAFDIVGLAGNRRRVAHQPGWLFIDEKLTPDSHENLSGVVAHGNGLAPTSITVFGAAGQAVKLLDGVFLATTSATLRANALRFDERFAFHFYDLDFCRQAEQAGLRMGTWPIAVVHESAGTFASEGWRRGYDLYLEKWRD